MYLFMGKVEIGWENSINLANINCTLVAPDKLDQVLNKHSQVFEEGLVIPKMLV